MQEDRAELENRWTAEQERIAQAVVETDDTSWMLAEQFNNTDGDVGVTTDSTCPSSSMGESPPVHSTRSQGATASLPYEHVTVTHSSPSDVDRIQSHLSGQHQPSPVTPRAAITKTVPPAHPQRQLRLVGGLDISFVKGSEENACATLVVLQYPSLETVYKAHERVTMPLPYISGFLAFREVDHLVRLVERLRAERPDLEPDVTFVDGNGRLHPRGAGLACHLGVSTGLRTVGIGKTFLQVDGLTKHGVRERANTAMAEGERETQLVGVSGTVWGTALLPKEEGKDYVVTNPVFVSVGHRVSLETCVALTKAVGRYRVPEPVRRADMSSREVVRKWLEEQSI